MRILLFTAIAGITGASVDPCTTLCNEDGPAVCTKGSWTERDACKHYFYLGNPAEQNYCYHTKETASVCPINSPVRPADVPALLAKKRGTSTTTTTTTDVPAGDAWTELQEELRQAIREAADQGHIWKQQVVALRADVDPEVRAEYMRTTRERIRKIRRHMRTNWINPENLPRATREEVIAEIRTLEEERRQGQNLPFAMIGARVRFDIPREGLNEFQYGRIAVKVREAIAFRRSLGGLDYERLERERRAGVSLFVERVQVYQEAKKQGHVLTPRHEIPLPIDATPEENEARLEADRAEIAMVRELIQREWIAPEDFPVTTVEEVNETMERLRETARARNMPLLLVAAPSGMNQAQLGRLLLKLRELEAQLNLQI